MATILDIIPYKVLPAQMGGQKGIAYFCEYLGEQHELYAITVKSNNPSLAKSYKLIPHFTDKKFRYANIFYLPFIIGTIKKNKIKNLIIEHPYLAWMGWLLKTFTGIKYFIHSHNIEYSRFKTLDKWWSPILKKYETWAYRSADIVFFKTPEDLEFAVNNKMIKAANARVLPFGIDIKELPHDLAAAKNEIYQLHNIPSSCTLIFFNGAFNYTPNTDALSFILNKINPLLLQAKDFDYRIIICGKDLPASFNDLSAYKNQHIIYAGFVDDINKYFKAAEIFLNPITTGGGVKTKVVEAIAMGNTVISCETGSAGLSKDACGNKLVLVNDNDENEFAEEIIKASKQKNTTPADYYQYYFWGSIIENISDSFSV